MNPRRRYVLKLLLLPILLLGTAEAAYCFNFMSSTAVEKLYRYAKSLNLENADSAATAFRKTADQYNKSMKKPEARACALSCMALSEILFDREIYGEALDYGIKGIHICNKHHIYDMLPYLYKTAGNVYAMYKDYSLALKNYEDAYRIAQRQRDSSAMMACIVNLSHISSYAGMLDEAENYNRKLTQFLARDSVIKYYLLINHAIVLTHKRQYDSALIYHDKALEYIRRQQLGPEFICNAQNEKAKLFIKTGNKDSAFNYIHSAMTIAEKNGYDYIIAELLESLVLFDELSSDSTLTSDYRTQYLKFQDSLFNGKYITNIRSTQFLHEINKYIDTIHKQKRLLTYAITAVLTTLIFCTILWKQKRELEESYHNLFNKNEEISRMEHNIRQSQKYSADKLSSARISQLEERIRHVMASDAICDSDFDLEKLAGLVQSNSKYISKVINEQFGKNFRALVNEQRIKRAKNMLTDLEHFGKYTIEAISSTLGYKSQATFIAAFKKSTGLTPSIYQRIAREKKKESTAVFSNSRI